MTTQNNQELKRLNKLYVIIIFASVLGAVGTTYGTALYHESRNVAIASQFGINSSIQLHLPFTFKANGYWQGNPNETFYTIADTNENITQITNLNKSNPIAYSKWKNETTINESSPVQDVQMDYGLVVFIAYGIMLLVWFDKKTQ